MRLCPMLVLLAGCFEPIAPAEVPTCGDGVCDASESALFCPQDCAQAPTPVPPSPPSPPPPACHEQNLGSALPVDVTDSTTAAPAALDTASCGDASTAPARTFAWTAPSSGRYTISASGDFALVL